MNFELEEQIAARKGGRPPNASRDPDAEIIREQTTWLTRLRRSGVLMDKIINSYSRDLEAAGINREGRMEIMSSLKDMISVQVRVVAECQKLREKRLAPPEESPALDLR